MRFTKDVVLWIRRGDETRWRKIRTYPNSESAFEHIYEIIEREKKYPVEPPMTGWRMEGTIIADPDPTLPW